MVVFGLSTKNKIDNAEPLPTQISNNTNLIQSTNQTFNTQDDEEYLMSRKDLNHIIMNRIDINFSDQDEMSEDEVLYSQFNEILPEKL